MNMKFLWKKNDPELVSKILLLLGNGKAMKEILENPNMYVRVVRKRGY